MHTSAFGSLVYLCRLVGEGKGKEKDPLFSVSSLLFCSSTHLMAYSQDALTSTTNGKLVNVRGRALVVVATAS